MTTVHRAVLFFVSVTIFIGGLTYAIILSNEISVGIEKASRWRADQDRNIYTKIETPPEYTVKGEEVLQSIFYIKDIGVDIEVDAYVYPKDIKIEDADVARIDITKEYVPTYERNTDGSIKKVFFNSK